MRQIKEMTAVIAKVLFNAKVEDSFAMLQEVERQKVFNLVEMTRNGKLKDAIEEIDRLSENNNKENLIIGLSFYESLSDVDEALLIGNGYNTAKLRKDFKRFADRYGLEQMVDLYFGDDE